MIKIFLKRGEFTVEAECFICDFCREMWEPTQRRFLGGLDVLKPFVRSFFQQILHWRFGQIFFDYIVDIFFGFDTTVLMHFFHLFRSHIYVRSPPSFWMAHGLNAQNIFKIFSPLFFRTGGIFTVVLDPRNDFRALLRGKSFKLLLCDVLK